LSLKKEILTKGFFSEQEKTFVNLIHTAAYFESEFSQFIKDFGLSPQQYNVLRILRGQSPNPILGGDLQKRMLHKMSNATRIVDKLVEKGFADRIKSDEDKRQILVSITKPGFDLMNVLDEEVFNFNSKVINLPEAQLMVLNILLDNLRTAVK
tara:strand:- start:6073 stop:6531 length:459 start_codon:yes stop_codon:yes gene_type:complete